MTSINYSLSPDLLFNIFKRLDLFETTRIRRVCKQWLKIVDEHKSFWRTLRLSKDSLEKWDPSILELFDEKSGSTLQDVDVKVPVEPELQDEFFATLKKSEKGLKHLFLEFPPRSSDLGDGGDFLEGFPNLKMLMVFRWQESSIVTLRRNVIEDQDQDPPDAASPLKVLWYDSGNAIWDKDPSRFQNLVSLDIADSGSQSQWREFLQGPSKFLKHLRVTFDSLSREEAASKSIPPLEFPSLEVLEIEAEGCLPLWLRFPSSVKVVDRRYSFKALSSHFPSISELWISSFNRKEFIYERLPILETLRVFEESDPKLELKEDLLEIVTIVTRRWKNVQDGRVVDGIPMEMIKTLILPFGLQTGKLEKKELEILERLRELVEDVRDGDCIPQSIEVEIDC